MKMMLRIMITTFLILIFSVKSFSQKINEDVRAAAIAHVKPFFDDLLATIKQVRGGINGQLEENTSVNMSPYKDSINNAESPKQKSAKNKISDLTRK